LCEIFKRPRAPSDDEYLAAIRQSRQFHVVVDGIGELFDTIPNSARHALAWELTRKVVKLEERAP
jgi:hypothetical protein